MNKKSTLLAVALMTMGSFTMNAEEPVKLGATDDFYYLKVDDKCLSLDGNKSDSVIVKPYSEFVTENATKSAIDSALWQIVDKQTELGINTYLIRNKATLQYLAFAPGEKLVPVLNTSISGVKRWVFTDGSDLKAYYGGSTYLSLSVTEEGLSLVDNEEGSPFKVEIPSPEFVLTAKQLGAGFQTFRLKFGDTYEGNIFEGKDLLAKDVVATDKEGYVTLQVKGDESYPNGVVKYFGVDTLKTSIAGAKDAFGYKFSLDSTRTVQKPNAAWQQFKFVIDLKNDSLSMFVAETPVAAESPLVGKIAKVVVAGVDNKNILTVSLPDEKGEYQGAAPSIALTKGSHATIPGGTGVYALKSASKGVNGGKYYVSANSFMGGDTIPYKEVPRGQWYIKANGGKYSVVDRESNSALIMNQEIFEVKGQKDTYLFGNDSITVIELAADLTDKYLGSLALTEQELVDKGFLLNPISGTSGVGDMYIYTNDSILQVIAKTTENEAIFKLIPVDTNVVAGARQLGDEISVISYELRALYNPGKVAKQSDSLKFSTTDPAVSFQFISDHTRQSYALKTDGGLYVGVNINAACLQLTKDVAYVNFSSIDAPEYASFANSHKRLVYNNNSLVMNPNTFLAETRIEGNEITKAGYEKDNFSLWVEQATELVDGKHLYYISSGMVNTNAADDNRYYLAAKDTLGGHAVFMYNDTIKTMKNSPALFAFKTVEGGGYYLENQSELSKNGKPYIGVTNGFAVMQEVPTAVFEVENAPAPVANEEIEAPTAVQIVGVVGEFSIRNAGGKRITISNILGQKIGTQMVSSDYVTVQTARGVVIVSVEGDKAYKVIVK